MTEPGGVLGTAGPRAEGYGAGWLDSVWLRIAYTCLFFAGAGEVPLLPFPPPPTAEEAERAVRRWEERERVRADPFHVAPAWVYEE